MSYAKAIEVALNYHFAVGAMLAACGYSQENVQVVSNASQLQRDYPDVSGLVAAVSVKLSSASDRYMKGGDVHHAARHGVLAHYGWLGPRRGMHMSAIRDGSVSVMGFWDDA